MDQFNPLNPVGMSREFTQQNTLVVIDMKVILKCIKEGKATRTYIYGLEDFLSGEKLEILIKNLPKKLGTSLFKKEENGKKMYGYSGDHRMEIKEILIKEKVPKDKISCK
jgi:translation initiation factor 1 (eIF-1/SUI1)